MPLKTRAGRVIRKTLHYRATRLYTGNEEVGLLLSYSELTRYISADRHAAAPGEYSGRIRPFYGNT